jgi:Asp-tRNA(Asn)/Glu-tRNA(Gln) amidotransferase A subunit family amidase
MNTNVRDESRRSFLATGAAATAAAVIPASSGRAQDAPASRADLSPATITEAEKLAAVEFTESERAMIVETIGDRIALFRRRREFALGNDMAPATVFDPRLPGVTYDVTARFERSTREAGHAPTAGEDIAYAPLWKLARWIETREITSEQLTHIYLHRLKEIGPKLLCVATLMEASALEQARRADAEIAAGRYRGPLHGIPWGAKDLLDTKGVLTAWGAEPYMKRVPDRDAAVVRRLDDAGAVLVAKLTLGAIAYGDIWYGGTTKNPWNLEQGSSGSSAGSASATAAGLVGFSIGTETLGSIVSPSMRCGTTGLRPTFGRVSRAGAMALCWSLDKIGPICRSVEDCMLVLNAINGGDVNDASSLDVSLSFDAARPVQGLRVGYVPAWLEGRRANDIDRACFDQARDLGIELVEVELPDLPYESLITILYVEAASAFEEITLQNTDDQLTWQAPQAWPNSFRATRFTPAIEFMQADRLRRQVMRAMHDVFETNRLDAMMGPSFAGDMLLITNNTGHPSITIRAGFRDDGSPHGFTIWGRLFDEGTIASIGLALEGRLSAWDRRPKL